MRRPDKNLRILPYGFDIYNCQNYKADCANFCCLLRKADLYVLGITQLCFSPEVETFEKKIIKEKES